MNELQDVVLKQLENILVVFKNLFRELGEQARSRNLTLDEYAQKENGDYKSEIEKIKTFIDQIPDVLDKQFLLDLYEEILELVELYNQKQNNDEKENN